MVVTTLQLPLFGSAGLADAMVACAPHTTKITMYLRPHEATTAIGYKLLTTAPQRWAVRPSAGVVQLDGVGMIEIALLGNATEEEVIDGCFHDRLLLLSVPLDADEAAQVHELQTHNLKETISAMQLDNPCASRTRITVLTAPEPDMVFPGLFSFERNSSGTDDSHSPATWQGETNAVGGWMHLPFPPRIRAGFLRLFSFYLNLPACCNSNTIARFLRSCECVIAGRRSEPGCWARANRLRSNGCKRGWSGSEW
eukprot:5384000-Pleurochrysis_carterae.AAC.6